jgi:hypothetical protein
MKPSPNLFISLHHWVSRQDENFTTDAFVYLLKYLQISEEPIFLKLVSSLSDGLIDTNIDKSHQIKISTQYRSENTIQDIEIETTNKLIFVEVKLGSGLDRKQVSTYLDLLRKSQYKPENTKLVCLTRSPISSDITDGTFPLRWYQVAEWFEQELNSTNRETSNFLIASFLEFLAFQNATLTKVSSTISQGLVNYQNIAGDQSILNKRFKSLDKLAQINELKPLHDLMLLIFETLKEIVGENLIKFDSGNNRSGRGFVAYNINKLEYFIYIEYKQPETLIFETFYRVIEKEQENLRLGKIVFEYKRLRWVNRIDLLTLDFFGLNKQDQLNLLKETIKTNLDFAKSVSKPWNKES